MRKRLHYKKSADDDWKTKVHTIIYGTDTKEGRLFDIILLWLILASVIIVMLESVSYIRTKFHILLYTLEWIFTIIFTVEYILRLMVVKKPINYATSFFGIVDLLSIIPTYLLVFFSGATSLLTIRILRLMRVFRVLKLIGFLKEAVVLRNALRASRAKLLVFLLAVISLVVILGSLMYIIEGEESGFTSIPRSIYWAIVTLTTVGYGDIAPQTALGQALASLVMILGYAIIAVPTGIVAADYSNSANNDISTIKTCPSCLEEGHKKKAKFCRACGSKL